jgi:predicted nucleotidyltransferase
MATRSECNQSSDIPGTVILDGYRGSQAHGTYVSPEDPASVDDIDYMGVFVMPMEYYLGLDGYHRKCDVTESFIGQIDRVNYEVRKFVHLLSGCNPNVLALLYNKPEHYMVLHPAGKLLIEHRNVFLSRRRVFETFGGYASNQLRRMTHIKFEGYMGAKRKALVERYGYDCKNAAHCVRLLKMGIELLTSGTLQVYRENDRNLLIEIKKGKYALSEVQLMADRLFSDLSVALDQSALPMENDMQAINALLVRVIKTVHA